MVSDQASILMHKFQDKDTFLVKLPHKFKEYLQDEDNFSLGKRDLIIGKIVDANMKNKINNPETGPERPTIEELFSPEEENCEYLMRLDLPRPLDEDDSPKKKSRMEPDYKR